MKKFKPNNFYLTVCMAAVFLTACGDKRDDDQVQQDIAKTISADQANKGAYRDVTSTVKDGVVTLSGQCEGDHCGDSVVARVKEVKGVKEVVNNLQESAAATDLTLRTSVQTIVSKYQGVQADVAAGVIVLRGTIQRDQIQPLMNELSTLAPKKIDNQLAVQQ